jgi:GT2 family glycosyltransferase
MLIQPLVYIIILNWNGWEDTLECLESLQALNYSNYHILVIDNASQNESVEKIKDWGQENNLFNSEIDPEKIEIFLENNVEIKCLFFPMGKSMSLIVNEENFGFSGGCNIGVNYVLERDADYVLLLNNDASTTPETLSQMLHVANKSDAGIVGAHIFCQDGKQIEFAGARWPQYLFAGGRIQSNADEVFWDSSFASGCALLLRHDLLKQRIAESGHLFDPKFFMYCEELDLCLYGQSRGYRCVIARDAIVYHKTSNSSGGKINSRTYYYCTRNRLYIAERWLNPYWKICFYLYYLPSRLFLFLFNSISGRWNTDIRMATISSLIDAYRQIDGKWINH